MQIVVKYCTICGFVKEFWLRSSIEPGFYCKCGVSRIMRNYYGAEYLDYFMGMIRFPITLEGLVALAAKEHMAVVPEQLGKKLQKYDLDNLTEQEFFDLARDVVASNDVFRFRKELLQFTDTEQMLQAIAKLNPRIDISGLRGFIRPFRPPLRKWQVILLEIAIASMYYHPEINTFSIS